MRTYEEQICQAVDVIAQEKINSANFDRTIEARILSCEDSLAGKYRVKYQNSTFIAYSGDNTITYEEGTFVYVLIPGNDPEKDKLILWAGADYSGRDTEQSAFSGWYGSGVGRFTNPEKNSELFNDYKKSKVDIKAQYCHIEGEQHTIVGPLKQCHIGGYGNSVSISAEEKRLNGHNSIIYCGNTAIQNIASSAIFGDNHKISSSDGVLVSGFSHHISSTDSSIIFGNSIKGESLNGCLIGGLPDTYHTPIYTSHMNYAILVGSLIEATSVDGGCYVGYDYKLRDSESAIVAGARHKGVKKYPTDDGKIVVINSLLVGYHNMVTDVGAGGNIIGGFENTLGGGEGTILCGYQNTANKFSLVTGANNTCVQDSCMVGGQRNYISARFALAVGYENNSEGEGSVIAGQSNYTSTNWSFIGGYQNGKENSKIYGESMGLFAQKINGGRFDRTVVSGYNHIVNGIMYNSFISGQEHKLSGSFYHSGIFGLKHEWTSANDKPPIFLIGQCAKQDRENYVFVIGNGKTKLNNITQENDIVYKSNAFAVDIDGNVYCKSINKISASGSGSSTDLSMFYTKEQSDLYFSKINKGIVFPKNETNENKDEENPLLGDIFFLQEEKVIQNENEEDETILEYKEPYICTPKGWEKLFYDDTNKITYKGIVEKIENLPSEDNKIGDLYLIKKYKTSSNKEEQEFLCYMEYLFTENGWEPIFYQEEDNRILLQLKGSLQNENELIALTNNQEGDSYFIFEETGGDNIPVAYQYIYFNSQWIKIGGKNIDETTTNKAIEELNKEIDTINNRITELENSSTPVQETIYLTNIDFTETGFTLTNSLSQTQSCIIEENVDGNKNIITITNTTTGAVLTITQPISSSSANSE